MDVGHRVVPWAGNSLITRYNPAKLLLDPYARAIDGEVHYGPELLGHATDNPSAPSPLDSAAQMPRGVVLAPAPELAAPQPQHALADTIMYEVHVRGFTATRQTIVSKAFVPEPSCRIGVDRGLPGVAGAQPVGGGVEFPADHHHRRQRRRRGGGEPGRWQVDQFIAVPKPRGGRVDAHRDDAALGGTLPLSCIAVTVPRSV